MRRSFLCKKFSRTNQAQHATRNNQAQHTTCTNQAQHATRNNQAQLIYVQQSSAVNQRANFAIKYLFIKRIPQQIFQRT